MITAVEGMQRGDGAGPVHLEDRAAPAGATETGPAVEVAIAGLDEARGLAAVDVAVEGMQRGDGAGPIHLEHRPPPPGGATETERGRAVEGAIAGLDEARGLAAIDVAEEGM